MYYTKEQIDAANQTDLAAFLLSKGEEQNVAAAKPCGFVNRFGFEKTSGILIMNSAAAMRFRF